MLREVDEDSKDAHISPDEEVELLLRGHLSPNKLQEITACQDLSKVKYLEIKVDTRETSLAGLGQSLPMLDQLKLNNSYITRIRDLGAWYQQITVLWIARAHLSDLDGIGILSGLKELYVAHNEILNLSDVSMLDSLEILDLEGNLIDDYEQVEYLCMCPNLSSLTLDGNPLMLEGLTVEVNLEMIEVDEEVIDKYRARIAGILPRLKYLDEVPMSPISEESAEKENKKVTGPQVHVVAKECPAENESYVGEIFVSRRPQSAFGAFRKSHRRAKGGEGIGVEMAGSVETPQEPFVGPSKPQTTGCIYTSQFLSNSVSNDSITSFVPRSASVSKPSSAFRSFSPASRLISNMQPFPMSQSSSQSQLQSFQMPAPPKTSPPAFARPRSISRPLTASSKEMSASEFTNGGSHSPKPPSTAPPNMMRPRGRQSSLPPLVTRSNQPPPLPVSREILDLAPIQTHSPRQLQLLSRNLLKGGRIIRISNPSLPRRKIDKIELYAQAFEDLPMRPSRVPQRIVSTGLPVK